MSYDLAAQLAGASLAWLLVQLAADIRARVEAHLFVCVGWT